LALPRLVFFSTSIAELKRSASTVPSSSPGWAGPPGDGCARPAASAAPARFARTSFHSALPMTSPHTSAISVQRTHSGASGARPKI
jgi:hypothetical protein